MEWGLIKPWINRVGILLEFLSFWLAAPEILGEERLRALERRVEQVIRQKWWLGLLLLLLTSQVVLVLRETKSPEINKGLAVMLWLIMELSIVVRMPRATRGGWGLWGVLTLVTLVDIVELALEAWRAETWTGIGIALLAAFVLALEAACAIKQPRNALVWATMAAVVMGWSIAWVGTMRTTVGSLLMKWRVLGIGTLLPWIFVEERLLPPLLRVLADDKRIRQRSLAVGAVLFVVGFLLQLIATF